MTAKHFPNRAGPHKKQPKTRQIRVIGGALKRQLIHFFPVDGLRPTPDRIRETVFNWLMWQLEDKRVLDICAGSGALGIEALSRGAAHCIFIEKDVQQAEQLKKELQRIGVDPARYEVLTGAAEALMPLITPKSIDLVFIDPPYASNLWSSLASLSDNVLQPAGVVYSEADRPLNSIVWPTDWAPYKMGKGGAVWFGLFKKAPIINE